jgi:hypothetical protein
LATPALQLGDLKSRKLAVSGRKKRAEGNPTETKKRKTLSAKNRSSGEKMSLPQPLQGTLCAPDALLDEKRCGIYCSGQESARRLKSEKMRKNEVCLRRYGETEAIKEICTWCCKKGES